MPELFGFKSLSLSHFWSEMLLVIVIKIRSVFLVLSGVSVLIKYISAEVVIFENILSVAAESVVEWDETLTESVDDPFRLQHELTHHWH